MPDPDNLVTFHDDLDTAATPLDTFQQPSLIGVADSDTESPPGPGFNVAEPYGSATSIADDFGDGSDVHVGAQQAFAEQPKTVNIVILERTQDEQLVEGSDSNQINTGVIPGNGPISGTADVMITVDGGDPLSVIDTTSSPPQPNESETLAADAVLLNRNTRELMLGTDTSGEGPGIEVTFSELSWTDGLDSLASIGTDIIDMATYRYDRSYIGDLDVLATWCDAHDVALPMVYVNGQTFARPEDGLELAQDMGTYIRSKFALPVSTESSEAALGARITGRFAIERAWYDIFLKTLDVSVPVPSRYERLVGAPELPGTFEGGIGQTGHSDGGAGASNVLMDDGGAVLTNSLTTAGNSSSYRYLDIARREAFIRDRARTAVSDLFRDNTVNFDKWGKSELESALTTELQQYRTGRDSPFKQIDAVVPDGEDIPRTDRANRIWTGIILDTVMRTPAHRADITLRIAV